jgi:endonuclease G
LQVISGVIWGDNPADDYFVQRHGVKTPDAFWNSLSMAKTASRPRLCPTPRTPPKNRLDQYIVSVEELEKKTGEKFPKVPEVLKTLKSA